MVGRFGPFSSFSEAACPRPCCVGGAMASTGLTTLTVLVTGRMPPSPSRNPANRRGHTGEKPSSEDCTVNNLQSNAVFDY